MTTTTRVYQRGRAAMSHEEFDAWIRANGWSVRSLAARMGTSPKVISRWRSGETRINKITALALEAVGERQSE